MFFFRVMTRILLLVLIDEGMALFCALSQQRVQTCQNTQPLGVFGGGVCLFLLVEMWILILKH